jgi:CDP-diacylglycerol--glycerol-3-phosphate 3-phosphatidyltransferase
VVLAATYAQHSATFPDIIARRAGAGHDHARAHERIPRRLGIVTPFLRRLDSIADSVFYVAATYCVWLMHPDVILGHATSLLLLFGLELGRYVFDFLKFRKEASYHMWSSKLWGLALFVAFFSILVFSNAGIAVSCAIYLGLLADAEGLVISMLLPYWKNDVPTLFHALRLRRASLSAALPDPADHIL